MPGFDCSSAIRPTRAAHSQITMGRQLRVWAGCQTDDAYHKLRIRFAGTVLFPAKLRDLHEKAEGDVYTLSLFNATLAALKQHSHKHKSGLTEPSHSRETRRASLFPPRPENKQL